MALLAYWLVSIKSWELLSEELLSEESVSLLLKLGKQLGNSSDELGFDSLLPSFLDNKVSKNFKFYSSLTGPY